MPVPLMLPVVPPKLLTDPTAPELDPNFTLLPATPNLTPNCFAKVLLAITILDSIITCRTGTSSFLINCLASSRRFAVSRMMSVFVLASTTTEPLEERIFKSSCLAVLICGWLMLEFVYPYWFEGEVAIE